MRTCFSTSAGKHLAEMLAMHIVRTEPVANRDECIDEIRELICEHSDRSANAPVSAFIKAEDRHRLTKKRKDNRYLINVREVCV